MKRLSTPEPHTSDPAYRLLMEKRCEVYNRTAGLLMEVEEALDGEDAERARLLLDDVRKARETARHRAQ